MATLYYNAAVNTNWSTLGNWWTDSSYSTQALSLPSSSDTVVIDGDVSTISSGVAVVDHVAGGYLISPRPTMDINLTTNTASFNFNIGSSGVLNITTNSIFSYDAAAYATTNYGIINVSGILGCGGTDTFINYGTINGDCNLWYGNNEGLINGNCIFADPTTAPNPGGGGWFENSTGGTIIGNCIIYTDYSRNEGNITGNCTFYDNSYNGYPGSISGNVTFNDDSGNGIYVDNINGGTIIGDVIFNDNSSHYGSNYSDALITGNITYNDYSYRANASSSSNMVVFNDYSSTEGGYFNDIDGNNAFVIFNDGSYILSGSVTVAQIMNDSSYITYGGYGSEVSNTFNDNSYVSSVVGAGGFPAIWTFNDNSYIDSSSTFYDNGGDRTSNPTMIFNHNSHTNCLDLDVNTATFNDSSYNNGNIVGNSVTFKDSSYNSASGVITGDEVYNDRTPYPIPRGINGSSILGII